MGAGRKKAHNHALKEKSGSHSTVNGSLTARNLTKKDLAGVIFGCKHNTIRECYSKQLFGLPSCHIAYIRNIYPGMPLFLFNYSDRKLHGIFEASSCGQSNIDPHGWTEDGTEYTSYPAQVRVRVRMECHPLLEDQFKPIIEKNYYAPRLFWFELDQGQTKRLISLFSSSRVTVHSSLVHNAANQMTKQRSLPPYHHGGNNLQPAASEADAADTDQSFVVTDFFWDATGLNAGCQLQQPPLNVEAAKMREQGGTNPPPRQKKWTSLFKDSPTSDIKKEDEDYDKLDSDVNFSYPDQSNLKWESSSPCLDGENQLLETPPDEGVVEYDEPQSWETNSDVPYSSLVKESSAYLPVSTSNDRVRDAEVCEALDSVVNLPHSDEFGRAWSTPSLGSCSEERRPKAEAATGEENIDMSEEEHMHVNSNSGCSNSSSMENDTNLCYHKDDTAPFVTELQCEDGFSSKTAVVPELVKPSDLHSVITKLINITEELKACQIAQTQNFSSLEHELEESKREIQQLKYKNKMLESSLLGHVGLQDELTVEPNACLHDSVFIVGGFDGLSWMTNLDLYSLSCDSLESLMPMNCVRSYAPAVKLANELYVLGGVDGDTWYNTVESYNPTKNQWISCPSMNQKKGSMAGISLNNKIFAIGGGNGIECFSQVEMLDLNAGCWINSRSMFQKRFAPAAAEINGILYVVGGYDGNEYLKSVERFDPREYSWTRIASMSMKRGCHSLAVLNDKLFALGGYNGDRMVSTVEVLDPRIGSWSIGESLNASRGYSGAVTIGDSIYTIGGLKDDNDILDTVECYKEGKGWQVSKLKAVGKRCFISAIVN